MEKFCSAALKTSIGSMQPYFSESLLCQRLSNYGIYKSVLNKEFLDPSKVFLWQEKNTSLQLTWVKNSVY